MQGRSLFDGFDLEEDPIEAVRSGLDDVKKLVIKTGAPTLRDTTPGEFLDWRKLFEAYLEKRNVTWFLHLPSFEQESVQNNFTRERNAYIIANRKFYSVLIDSLPRSIRTKVSGFARKDGAKAWQTLQESVITRSRGRKNYIRDKLNNAVMKEHQSPEAFISYIQKLIEELRLTGDHTTDAEIVTLLLKKLPSNYDACIQYYERLEEHEKTLERLTEEISKSYEIQKYRDPERFHVEKQRGLKGPKKQLNAATQEWKKNLTCHNCGEKGHFARECKKNSTRRKKNQRNYEKPKVVELGTARTIRREDWALNTNLFSTICKTLHVEASIDLCATTKSTKCQNFYTKEDDYLSKEWKQSTCYLNPPFVDIPKVLKKVYKSVKKHKNKFLMVLPQWKRSAWYPQLIKSTRSPILILPKLSEGVFTNTERSVNEEKIPEWRVIALLIEDCDEMTSSAPTFLEILPEQNDFYREVSSCDIITSTTLQLDSGCNQHMIGNKNMLRDLHKKDTRIVLADGSTIVSTHIGTATAFLETATGEEVEVRFKNALYVPKLPKNLISIGQLSNLESASVTMDFNKMILNISDSFSLKMIEKNQLFFLASVNKSYKTCSLSDARALNNSIQTVHQRFGHPGVGKTSMFKKHYGIKTHSKNCTCCKESKSKRTTFPPSPLEHQAKERLDKVSVDTAIVKTVSENGYRYVLGFLDHKTRFLFTHLMREKSDAYEGFKHFETQIGIPKCYRIDGEYVESTFKQSCLDRRIRIEMTCPYSSQQNAHIETQWRTIFQIARANLRQSRLPLHYWEYAISYATFQKNLWPLQYQNAYGTTYLSMLKGNVLSVRRKQSNV